MSAVVHFFRTELMPSATRPPNAPPIAPPIAPPGTLPSVTWLRAINTTAPKTAHRIEMRWSVRLGFAGGILGGWLLKRYAVAWLGNGSKSVPFAFMETETRAQRNSVVQLVHAPACCYQS